MGVRQAAVAVATLAADVAVQASAMMGIGDRARSNNNSHSSIRGITRSRAASRAGSEVSRREVSRREENEAVVLDAEDGDDDLILNSPPLLTGRRHSAVRCGVALHCIALMR